MYLRDMAFKEKQADIAKRVLAKIKSMPSEELKIKILDAPKDALFWAILGLFASEKETATSERKVECDQKSGTRKN